MQQKFIPKYGIDNNNLVLSGVADPVNAQDAATKNFSTNASNITTGTLASSILPVSGVTAGTYNSSTEIVPLVIDSKGRVTSVGTSVTISPSFSSITSKPSTLAGYGITDAVQLNSPSFTGVPLVPTASTGTNSQQIASTAFIQNTVQKLLSFGTAQTLTITEINQACSNLSIGAPDTNFSAIFLTTIGS